MKVVIDIPERVITAIQHGKDYRYDIHTAIAQGIPYEKISQGECVEEIIDELESRKDYGAEYAQAMEDVITILKAKFGIDKERRRMTDDMKRLIVVLQSKGQVITTEDMQYIAGVISENEWLGFDEETDNE